MASRCARSALRRTWSGVGLGLRLGLGLGSGLRLGLGSGLGLECLAPHLFLDGEGGSAAARECLLQVEGAQSKQS